MTFRLFTFLFLSAKLSGKYRTSGGLNLTQRNTRPALGNSVMVRLDESTNSRLINAKNRSGRSKSNEMAVRLKDHLERFPDFYNSEYAEEMPTQKK